MSARDPFSDDRPEIVPPAELLRLRARLSRPPSPAVRAQHLTAVATAARQSGVVGHVGRFATGGARIAVAIVASLAITSGLAAAQVLPEPAQRLLSNVSDRFAPEPDAPPARADEPERDSGSPTTDAPSRLERDAATTAGDGDGSEVGGVSGGDTTTSIAPVTPTTTPIVVVAAPTTTIPGPAGPGSPTDPTDPTDPTTTTTIDPGSTTTTTDPGSTTTTTTTPGGATTTTTGGTSP